MKTGHTFGGRYFDRFIDFEPDDGLGGGDAPIVLEGSEVTPPAPAAPAPVAPVELEGAAAEPVPLTREDVITAAREAALEGSGEAFRSMMAQIEQEDAARRAAVPAALPEWDPYDPQSVMTHIVAGLTPLFRELETKANAGMSVAEARVQEQGKSEAYSLLDGLMEGDNAIGEFDKERAIAGARMLLMIDGTLAPDEALKRAAQAEVDYAQTLELRTMERLGIVAENHRAVTPEPGSGAAAAAEVSSLPRGKDAYKVQLERSLAARGQRPGVGAPV